QHQKTNVYPTAGCSPRRISSWGLPLKTAPLANPIPPRGPTCCRAPGINLRCGLFYLLSVSQNERSKRIPNSTDHESKSDKDCHHLSPHSFAPQLHSLRPLPCIADITHSQQP